ncbi:MAG TPA: hypothetical protein VIP51_10110 [Eoetvoesiella sp.]
MASKTRFEGTEAIAGFIRDTRLPFELDQAVKAELIVSAKAGDKWRLTRVPLSIEFRYTDGAPEILIESIVRPFYRTYRPMHGTRFIYDSLKAKLIIEGNLNKGRGDPYEISLYPKRSA